MEKRWLYVVILLSVGPHASAAAEPSSGFDLCVAPYPPACVNEPRKQLKRDECESELRAYTAAVFHFRECIEAESAREVRRANEVLDHWKCRLSKANCRQ